MESKLEAMVGGKDPNPLAVPREYEFDSTENEVIGGLSSSMKFVGIVSIILGIIQALGGVLGGANLAAFITLGQGIVLIVIGGWLAGAAGSFRDVVTTEGNDISHMMAALRKLRSVYTLQAVLLGIGCVLAVLLIFLVIGRAH